MIVRLLKYAALIVVLVLTSGAFFNLIFDDDTGVTAALHGDDKLQWMWAAIDLVVVIVCTFHGRQLIRAALRQPFLLAFILWGLSSTIWSQDPQLTIRRTLGLACTVALGILLGTRFELEELSKIVAWVLAIAVVASIVAAVAFPSLGVMTGGDSGAWRGVFVHKNTMARVIGLAVILFACLLLEARRSRVIYLISLALGVGLLIRSHSMTGIVVTFLTMCVWLFLRSRPRPALAVALVSFLFLFGLGAAFFLQGSVGSMFELMGRDVSLTGRTELWQLSVGAILRRPLLGSGWDVFWMGPDGDTIRGLIRWPAPHAHNAFIDLSLNTGLIGLGIFLVSLADCLRRAWHYSREQARSLSLWPFLFYLYLFLYMFTETTTVDRHSLFNILYCAISVSMTETLRAEEIENRSEVPNLLFGLNPDSGLLQELR